MLIVCNRDVFCSVKKIIIHKKLRFNCIGPSRETKKLLHLNCIIMYAIFVREKKRDLKTLKKTDFTRYYVASYIIEFESHANISVWNLCFVKPDVKLKKKCEPSISRQDFREMRAYLVDALSRYFYLTVKIVVARRGGDAVEAEGKPALPGFLQPWLVVAVSTCLTVGPLASVKHSPSSPTLRFGVSFPRPPPARRTKTKRDDRLRRSRLTISSGFTWFFFSAQRKKLVRFRLWPGESPRRIILRDDATSLSVLWQQVSSLFFSSKWPRW